MKPLRQSASKPSDHQIDEESIIARRQKHDTDGLTGSYAMSDPGKSDRREPLSKTAFEQRLRSIGLERYHDLHPFHRMLHEGKLNKGQVQAWALNRYYYQISIPIKDAALMSKMKDSDLRRNWIRRIQDHDGDGPDSGGIERWYKLTDGLGLDRDMVRSTGAILPATRFAVDAYVHYVRERSLLEGITSSLTELFAPSIHKERISGMLSHYDFISEDVMSYFRKRLDQATRDADFVLAYALDHAVTRAQQEAVLAALVFKTDVLWVMLDALYHAYVDGFIPKGVYCPGDFDGRTRAA